MEKAMGQAISGMWICNHSARTHTSNPTGGAWSQAYTFIITGYLASFDLLSTTGVALSTAGSPLVDSPLGNLYPKK